MQYVRRSILNFHLISPTITLTSNFAFVSGHRLIAHCSSVCRKSFASEGRTGRRVKLPGRGKGNEEFPDEGKRGRRKTEGGNYVVILERLKSHHDLVKRKLLM